VNTKRVIQYFATIASYGDPSKKEPLDGRMQVFTDFRTSTLTLYSDKHYADLSKVTYSHSVFILNKEACSF
jgi:hypothetical protein